MRRTVLFYHVGVVTFLLGFGFALAPQPSTGAYVFRWIASGVAFAVCLIEAGVYVNRELRERDLRRFEGTVGCHQQALVICPETDDRHGEGQALTNLGNAYRALRQFEEAVGCYQQALVICRETGDRRGEGQALTNLGNAYRALRQFEGAVGCHKRALVICRETGDRHGEGQALTNLGNAYQELRLSDRAAVSWRDAAAAMRDAGEHKQAARLEQLAASGRARRRRWRRSG